jgi:hypothetical protein
MGDGERTLEALIRSGDIAVGGHRDTKSDDRHDDILPQLKFDIFLPS